MPDIDIDVADRDEVIRHLPKAVHAVLTGTERRRHPSGIYLQDVPVHPLDGHCAWDYARAEGYGFLKIDILNNSIYEGVRDEDHMQALMAREPDWTLLQLRDAVDVLPHLNGNFRIVKAIQPRSVEDLAVCLALIRPGKRHLLSRPRSEIDADIWQPDDSGYTFKKSHATAYAMSVVIQMNLISEALEKDE